MITTENNKIQCAFDNVTLSSEPNKMIITGCITKIGASSDGSPCGADGKLVVFTPESVQSCGNTFIGSALNCVFPEGLFADCAEMFTDHGYENIGFLRNIKAEGDNLMAEIVVWKSRFPEVAEMIMNGMDSLGFSIEAYVTKSHEDETTVYVDEFEGDGCAILWKSCAAFSDTFIEHLAAARSDVEMTEKEKQEFTELINASIDSKLEEIKASIEEVKASKESIEASIEELKEKPVEIPEEIKASIDEIKSKAEAYDADIAELKAQKIQASVAEPVIPQPKASQHVEENPVIASEDKVSAIDKINASAMSPMEKLKEITKLRAKKD